MPRTMRKRGSDKRRGGKYTALPKQWTTRLHQPELKIFTTQFTSVNSFGGATALLNSWSAVSQGVSSIERVGQKIQPAKFEAHVNLGLSAGLTGGRFVRVLFFQWFEDDNVLIPTAVDILQDTASGAELVNSPFKRTARRLFKILYDNTFVLYDAAPAKRTIVSRSHSQMTPITYSNDGTAIGGVSQIYSLVCSDSPVSPGDVNLSVAVKLAYADS